MSGRDQKAQQWSGNIPNTQVEQPTAHSSKSTPAVRDKRGVPSEDWIIPVLREKEYIKNIDNLPPATLYYLTLISDIEKVREVYVEKLKSGKVKHWVTLSEKDYDVKDKIYDIEQDTIERFPEQRLGFRVTIYHEEGPSIESTATKVFEKK